MTDFREPTERDRYWLDQEAKRLASGLTAKAYAADHNLPIHALYQSRKRLRALGLLERTRAVRAETKNRSPKTMAFSKVDLASPRRSTPDFRLSLPNGLVLEWWGGELPSPASLRPGRPSRNIAGRIRRCPQSRAPFAAQTLHPPSRESCRGPLALTLGRSRL